MLPGLCFGSMMAYIAQVNILLFYYIYMGTDSYTVFKSDPGFEKYLIRIQIFEGLDKGLVVLTKYILVGQRYIMYLNYFFFDIDWMIIDTQICLIIEKYQDTDPDSRILSPSRSAILHSLFTLIYLWFLWGSIFLTKLFCWLSPNKCTVRQYGSRDLYFRTERFTYYRKSVLHLIKHMFHVHVSRCSTDLG